MGWFAHGDGVLKQWPQLQENMVWSVILMDHHCSGPLWIRDTHIFTSIMVNNNTFIAYYSYPVGLICPPIQHLHDIAEANKDSKSMKLALEEQFGCHMLPCAAVAVGGCKAGCLSESWRGLSNMYLCTVLRLDCFGCSCTFYWGQEGSWGMLPLNLGIWSYLCFPSSPVGGFE